MALSGGPAQIELSPYSSSLTRSLEANFADGATVPVADDLARRAAELFAIAFTVAAGVVAAFADAGIAAFGTAFIRSGGTDAGGAIPGLPAGAFRDGGSWRWATGSLGRLQSGASRQTAKTEQSLENRSAALPAGE
jgi:hypothetical protein